MSKRRCVNVRLFGLLHANGGFELASQLGPGEHRSSGQYVLPVTLKGSANDNVFRRFRMIGLLRPSCIVLSQSRGGKKQGGGASERSEEHTSELQSLMRN